jgi:hypothetical protein
VKVSTANGAIEPGDRIAPSSDAGVGMRAFPDSPQTIGIALEPFDDDTDGTIIVFIDTDYRTLSDSLTDSTFTGESKTLASLRSITGAWSISEDGDLVVESLEVRGSAAIPEFTLFDKKDGTPYCVKVVGEQVKTVEGVCQSQNTATTTPVTGATSTRQETPTSISTSSTPPST